MLFAERFSDRFELVLENGSEAEELLQRGTAVVGAKAAICPDLGRLYLLYQSGGVGEDDKPDG
jgi:hypothetical protein